MVQIQQISTSELETIIENVLNRVIKQPEPAPKESEFITRQKTAQFLGISLVTLNEYTKKGIVTGYRIGSRVRYKKQEIENSLQKIKSVKYRGV